MVVNASPDAQSLDILADQTLFSRDFASVLVPFPNNGSYFSVPSVSLDIRLNQAGSKTSLLDTTLNLQLSSYHTLFATGKASSIRPLLVTDTQYP